jgi:hypothetical protein
MLHNKGRPENGTMNEPMEPVVLIRTVLSKFKKKKMHKMKVENHCGLQNLQMRVYSPVKVIKSSVVQLAFLTEVVSREVQEQ